jgi:molecular chaperone DnaJ
VPRRLTKRQKELLAELNESLTEDNLREDEGMLAKLRRALAG